ncbi:hypothetical protein CPC08DRAFT_702543 [Agrocybe pediades]|nr:hypothetical protein CPC08DRAFT_702543 [Agrocybe pediades]
MLSLKNEAIEGLMSLASPNSASNDFESWRNNSFSSNMDHEQSLNNRSSRNNIQRSRSTSDANTSRQLRQTHPSLVGGSSKYDNPNFLDASTGASILLDAQDASLLARFAASAPGNNDINHLYANMLPPNSLPQNPYPSMNPTPGFFGSFLHHTSMGPPQPQLPPLSSLDFSWNPIPDEHHSAPGQHTLQQNYPGPSLQTNPYLSSDYSSPSAPHQESARSGRRTSQATAGGSGTRAHSNSSPEVELTDAERQAIADEKRRRNTAASARFRIKKKHKTINLERSVSDLTGRAEELEREAADLRRENGWLKEIVMLKGTRFAASNLAHREALSQAAALAIGGTYSADQARGGPSGSGGAHEPDQGSGDQGEESGSSESENEEDPEYRQEEKSKPDPKSKKK